MDSGLAPSAAPRNDERWIHDGDSFWPDQLLTGRTTIQAAAFEQGRVVETQSDLPV